MYVPNFTYEFLKNYVFTVTNDFPEQKRLVLQALEAANRDVEEIAKREEHSVATDSIQYLSYSITPNYRTKSGHIVCPASRGHPGKIIKLHAPITIKRVSFGLARVGNHPIIPSPNPETSFEILIRTSITPTTEFPTITGVRIFLVSGEYVYQTTRPYQNGEIAYPKTPLTGCTRFPITDKSFSIHYGAYCKEENLSLFKG